MTIELVDHRDGVLLPVKAQPGARKAGIRGEHGGMLKVSVTRAAQQGKANEALIVELAKALGVARSQIELVGGQLHSQKKFLIRGVTRQSLAERIAAALTE